MNTLPENTTEYPKDFELNMKFFFGLNETDDLDKIQIPNSNNIQFTVGNLYKAILKWELSNSQDAHNPSWDYIDNHGKDLKPDSLFPHASLKDLEEIYYAITYAVKRYVVDWKSLASTHVTLDPHQYAIYGFVIDRFYKSMITKLQSNWHNRALAVLDMTTV